MYIKIYTLYNTTVFIQKLLWLLILFPSHLHKISLNISIIILKSFTLIRKHSLICLIPKSPLDPCYRLAMKNDILRIFQLAR